MDVPAPVAGIVKKVLVSEGREVEEGDPLLIMETAAATVEEAAPREEAKPGEPEKEAEREEEAETEAVQARRAQAEAEEEAGKGAPSREEAEAAVHAGPAVRKQARDYGLELSQVKGTGPEGRILKEDVQAFVRERLSGERAGGIPAVPEVDFSKYGEIEYRELSRVRKISARNLHRSWLNVPHVTQFDEADVTDLEAFRAARNEELKDAGIKITPLAFLVKVCADALVRFPRFNGSLDKNLEYLIVKKYYNIGIAVDTDEGLVVPVIKNADKKGVVELAKETAELAAQARDKKLPLDAMQGATFTISSLGGIGGTAFTPIVNAPEVAILGVSRARIKPVHDGNGFTPRTILPLSLSYDHRAIDGAEAARFTVWLARALSDVRHLLM